MVVLPNVEVWTVPDLLSVVHSAFLDTRHRVREDVHTRFVHITHLSVTVTLVSPI